MSILPIFALNFSLVLKIFEHIWCTDTIAKKKQMMRRTMTTMSSSMSIPKLKIVGGASFRSFRNLWMFEELGIPYEYVPAMVRLVQQKVEDPIIPQSSIVLQYNPLGKVPVLVEENEVDGTVFSMYESGPINTYLGDKYCSINTSSTLGQMNNRIHHPTVGTHERALYDQTLSVILSELDSQGLWIHRKHEALGHIFQTIPEAVEHARKYFHKTNRVLMKQLQDSMENVQQQQSDGDHGDYYLLGPKFTAVDICYVHCLDWSKTIGWHDKWTQNHCLVDYLDRVRSRPAYQNVKSIRQAEQQKQQAQATTDKSSKI